MTTTDATPTIAPPELTRLAVTLTALGWETRATTNGPYTSLDILMRDDDLSTIHEVRIETQDPTELGLIEALELVTMTLRHMEAG